MIDWVALGQGLVAGLVIVLLVAAIVGQYAELQERYERRVAERRARELRDRIRTEIAETPDGRHVA